MRLAVVAAGGALGAVVRYLLTDAAPDRGGFPWTVLAINVTGALLLALLPVLGAVRRSRLLADGLGPGVLGGFTTLSTFSEQTRALLVADHTGLAAAYVVTTVTAGTLAVALGRSLSSRAQGDEVAAEGGDE